MIANVIISSTGPKRADKSNPSVAGLTDSFGASSVSKSDIDVLLVEDDYFAALTLENALSDEGYGIAGVVDTAEEAIKILGDARPELVICDIRLAGKQDGLDVAKEAMKLAIPFVVTSAHTDAETKARGEALSPAGWLVKPFGVPDFLLVVDAALSKDATH